MSASEEVRREQSRRTAASEPARQLARLVSEALDGAPVRPPDEPPRTLDELVDNLREYAAERLADLDPDDDVTQMTDIVGAERDIVLVHPFTNDEAQEHAYVRFVPAVAEAAHARCLATVEHAWMVFGGPDPGEPGFVRPKDNPDRVEALIVRGTDGLRLLQHAALVVREDGQPPRISEWLEPVDVPAEDASGSTLTPSIESVWGVRLARATRMWLFTRPAEWWTRRRREAFRVTDEAAAMRSQGEARTGQAEMSSFLTLFLDANGHLEPEIHEMARDPDLWAREMPDYTETPWLP